MTDSPYKNTGDELGRVGLGEIGELVIFDDGDDDAHCRYIVEHPDGAERTLGSALIVARENIGDEAVVDALDALGSGGSPDSDATSPTKRLLNQPVSFKCAECGLTWPRTRNSNVGDGPDVCEDCADGGGDGS